MSLASESPIAVTGATGYVASWVVHELLQRGATVHGTVRDPSQRSRVAYLHDMAASLPGNLQLFAADLLDAKSFAPAFDGCTTVIHTASPFLFGKIRDPQAQVVTPALEGTRNVLTQVNATPSVQRVVLTSSMAAIYGDAIECAEAGGTLTEKHWNTSSSLQHQPYCYSKTVAEREAWKMAEAQHRWRLVVINPSFIMGPSLPPDRRDGASMEWMRNTLNGTWRFGTLDQMTGWVDVREVARGHVEAAVRPDAQGRHIVSAGELSFLEAGRVIARVLGSTAKIPLFPVPKLLSYILGPLNGFSMHYIARNVGHRVHYDNSKSQKQLGLAYRPIEDTLVEHARQMLEHL